MGMSTTVIGFTPPDEIWAKHKAVWDACKAAGVDPPRETRTFFDDREPDPNGVKVYLEKTEWRDDWAEGFEIKVSDIPKNCTVIRFYNSW